MRQRAFDKKLDYKNLKEFLAQMREAYGEAHYFHYGDLAYRMHLAGNQFDFERDIRIWEHEGRTIGFVLYTAVDANPEYLIHPDYYESILEEAVRWSLSRALEENIDEIETSCMDSDALKAEWLEQLGFKTFDDPYVFMVCDLSFFSAHYKLPKGYTFGTAKQYPKLHGISSGEDEIGYKAMTSSPGYIDELGIRVVYKDNEIAAGCICWIDDIDLTAEFEPVGTVSTHRKKGLAYAAMARSMEILKTRNIRRVYVKTVKSNDPAIGLYKKLGFEITHEDIGYSLRTDTIK